VQGLNLWRTDLKPLIELSKQNAAALERIEKRFDDHEQRIQKLEAAQVSGGVWRKVKR
jgi:hypothetical protein